MKRTQTAAKVMAVAGALLAASHSAAQAQVAWDPAFYATGTSVTVTYMGASASFFDEMQWFKVPFSSITLYQPAPGPLTHPIVNYDLLGGVSGTSYQNLFANKNHPGGPTKSYSGATTILNGGPATLVGTAKVLPTMVNQEVLLGLFVQNELGKPALPAKDNPTWYKQDRDDYTYFSGGSARNIDNYFHLKVNQVGPTTFNAYNGYGWEDIRYGQPSRDDDYNDLMFKIEGVTLTPSVTPEPATMIMLGTGLFSVAGAAAAKRRRRKEQASA